MTRSYRPGLFHGYAVADLPRTNNGLEQLFGSYRRHERRATGRKANGSAAVLRGPVRLLAGLATRLRRRDAGDLAGADRARWREVRASLERRRHARVLRRGSAAIPLPTSAGSNSSSASQLCRLRKKRRRDRLIRLARDRPGWAFGFADEVWFSRLAQPALHAWTAGEPLRLGLHAAGRDDPEPKALACYGLWLPERERMLLRFVAGRPISGVTCAFLAWVAGRLAAEGVRVLLLIWDNAPWHVSRAVRAWIAAHNRRVKRDGGCRLLVCRLPSKSPWLNPIEPKWMHGKRAVVEADRKLTAEELQQRLCDHYRCPLAEPLAQQAA